MDALGWLYLVIAIVGIALIDALLLDITKRKPRGGALLMAFALMVSSGLISESDSRELALLKGALRFAGFIGIFIGLYGLVRKLPDEGPTRAARHPKA